MHTDTLKDSARVVGVALIIIGLSGLIMNTPVRDSLLLASGFMVFGPLYFALKKTGKLGWQGVAIIVIVILGWLMMLNVGIAVEQHSNDSGSSGNSTSTDGF